MYHGCLCTGNSVFVCTSSHTVYFSIADCLSFAEWRSFMSTIFSDIQSRLNLTWLPILRGVLCVNTSIINYIIDMPYMTYVLYHRSKTCVKWLTLSYTCLTLTYYNIIDMPYVHDCTNCIISFSDNHLKLSLTGLEEGVNFEELLGRVQHA